MKKITTNHVPTGHYTPAMEHGGFIFISGQLSIDPVTGKVPGADIHSQTEQALSNLGTVLKAAGVEKTDVIQCRIYTQNAEYWDAINRVYSEFFGDHKPARAIVPCGGLHHGCLVEIEAVAIRR